MRDRADETDKQEAFEEEEEEEASTSLLASWRECFAQCTADKTNLSLKSVSGISVQVICGANV